MACFQQIVLDYLEEYQPQEFEILKAEGRLRARMDELVAQLYAQRDRDFSALRQAQPEYEDEPLLLVAEEMALITVLPFYGIMPLDDHDVIDENSTI